MRRPGLVFVVLLAVVVVPTLLAPRQADAIPAFARKYRFSCSTCHAPFPRLKPFGEEFAARGFRLEDPKQEPTRAFYAVGDPLLKLPRELPLAVRLEGHLSVKEDALAESDTEWPWAWKILSGGPISDRIAYYFYFLEEKGGVEGLEDAWIQINGVPAPSVNLTVGQFQVCDPLFKRELRLTRSDYSIFATHVGNAQVDLTYDRGLVLNWRTPTDTEVVFQLVNGIGLTHADDFGNFDRDGYKNLALRAAHPLANTRIGLFGYWGKEKGAGGNTNRTWYWGPDLVWDINESWQLSAEYLERRDSDPFFAGGGGADWVTRGGFLELHHFPQGLDGRWIFTALYNRVDSDDLAARVDDLSLAGNYLLARNARFFMEIGRSFEGGLNHLTVGLVTAF